MLYYNVMIFTNKQLGTLNNLVFLKLIEIASWHLSLLVVSLSVQSADSHNTGSVAVIHLHRQGDIWLCCHIARNLPYAYIVYSYYREGLWGSNA